MEHLTPEQKSMAVEMVRRVADLIEQMPENRDCRQCLHFENGICLYHTPKGKDAEPARVPDEFLPRGCDAWSWLPF